MEKRAPVIRAAAAKSSASPARMTWSRGSKSNVGRSPQAWISTLSSSSSPRRHGRVGQVRDAFEKAVEFRAQRLETPARLVEALSQVPHFGDAGRDVLAPRLGRADGPRPLVALRLEGFGFLLQGLALDLKGRKTVQVEVEPTYFQGVAHFDRVAPQVIAIQHYSSLDPLVSEVVPVSEAASWRRRAVRE